MTIDLSAFPIGTVLNTYGEHPKNLLARFVYAQIRAYQKRKYPYSLRTDAIHSMIHVGEGKYLSVQNPRAVILAPQFKPRDRFTAWQYKHLDRFDGPAWAAFHDAVREIESTRYDYGQLLDILVHQLFGWLPQKLSIFDFSRKRKVCSVAAHAVLLAAYKKTAQDFPRPLGDQYVECTCPADFENHETFVCIAGAQKKRPQQAAASEYAEEENQSRTAVTR